MYRLRFKASCSVVFDVVDHLDQFFDTVSCFEDESSAPSTMLDDNDFPIASLFDVDVIFQDKTQALLVQTLLDEINIKIDHFDVEEIDNQDWLALCYKNFKPIEVGSYFIHSSYAPETVPDNAIGLLIDAATAFGSGEHQTTKGCLNAISDILDDVDSIESVLDMGCGSGILGIATHLKKSTTTVLCVDMDEKAVHVADENIKLNNAKGCKACTSNGFQHVGGLYDLLIANILAKPLITMAQDMKDHAKAGAFVVLSGLLTRQREDVLAAYKNVGFIFLDDYIIDDWCTLVLKG
ncbi:MAG: Release factor glutamine methyltransferase [Holosporales bacterium]